MRIMRMSVTECEIDCECSECCEHAEHDHFVCLDCGTEIEARAKAYQHSRELLSQLKGLVETIECVDHRLIEDLNPAIGEFVWSAKKVIKKVEGM
jgi:Fe2+ or Zn2+ uptake regulation protein